MLRTRWIFTLSILAVCGVARAESYTFEPLPTLGGTASFGSDINVHGKAVGRSLNPSVLWRGFTHEGGVMADLGTLGGNFSIANKVNEHGDIAGGSNVAGDTETHAVIWSGFGITDLGVIPNYKSAIGFGINKHAEVVGEATLRPIGATALPLSLAFFVGSGGMISLPDLGGRFNRANAINKHHEIAGHCELANSPDLRATVWTQNNKGVWSFNTLGSLPGLSSSSANAINDHSVVVGWSFDESITTAKAFVYDGVMTELPGLGGNRTAATGINKRAQIVGYSQVPITQARHAVMWVDGVVIDLNTVLPAGSGWVLNNAGAISDNGDIVGTATDPLGQVRGYILRYNPGNS